MKKLVLVLVLVLAFALPVLANPFADVPLNHWAYDAVDYLAARGVVIGYPDGTFGGNRMLTRYEFAEAIARVVANIDSMGFASAEDVAILEKLAIEFADELASLGVTVADLEAAVGANSAAIAALEAKVARYDYFFEPLKITGQFRATYNQVVLPAMGPATLVDRTRLWFEAEINENTKAGIRLQIENALMGTPVFTLSDFWIDFGKDNLSIRVGDVLPDALGLGLIAYYEADECDSYNFNGFLASWTWNDNEDTTDWGKWTFFGNITDYYTLHLGFALGDEDEVALGVTASYDILAGGYAGGADVAFGLGDEDEVGVALEAAAFYNTALSALSYAAAAKVTASLDDLDLTVKGYYVLPGFVPTMSDYTADRLGGYVEAKYPFTDQVTGKARFTYEMDAAMAAVVTTKVKGTLLYVPEDAAAGENAEVYAEYNLLTSNIKGFARYMNYPLADDFVLSGFAQVTYPTVTYLGAATLEYDLAEDMVLSVEGRVDSAGVVPYSAEAQIAYALATNTKLTFGVEMNDWAGDLKDYDDIASCEADTGILDANTSLKAQLTVSF
ncbi:MAG: S-layer homology domain-containing protein [Actinobacteria bacterium]|nr:S-layer homology domain-containing protein [Actinomycetota bacterium]